MGSQAKVLATLNVNGEVHEVAFTPHKSLLEVLREDLGLTGTKHGCGQLLRLDGHSKRVQELGTPIDLYLKLAPALIQAGELVADPLVEPFHYLGQAGAARLGALTDTHDLSALE